MNKVWVEHFFLGELGLTIEAQFAEQHIYRDEEASCHKAKVLTKQVRD